MTEDEPVVGVGAKSLDEIRLFLDQAARDGLAPEWDEEGHNLKITVKPGQAGRFRPSDSYPAQGDRDLLAKAQRPHPPKATLPDAGEEIAEAVEDLRKRRVRVPDDRTLKKSEASLAKGYLLERAAGVETVVDATAIYNAMLGPDGKGGKEIAYYEDHPCITPPWDEAVICYQNGHGNVVVMETSTTESDGKERWQVVKEVGHDASVEWERVKWLTDVTVYLGGQEGTGRRLGTVGPVHMWRLAIYEDGKPADISWINLSPDYPMELWDMALAVELGALNFLNCKNVHLVEPPRPRAQRRRMERTGVTVKVLNVTQIGRYRPGAKGAAANVGVPLTSVRGHPVEYGPKYGKGLLFGWIEGRFWIPQHARGSAEFGEHRNSYRLKDRQA